MGGRYKTFAGRMISMLLAQKYAPEKIDGIAGNEEARTTIKRWMLEWLRGKRQRPILIYGPTGTGKTVVAYALKSEFDLELVEMNASDLRNTANVERVLASAGSSFSLSGKGKILLIDDVDALQKNDRGGAPAIVSVMKNSSVPILLTAGDVWDRKLAGIRGEAQLIQFRRISKSSVKKVLQKIAEKEGIKISEPALESISENCAGDLRSAINDLQAGMNGMRDREKDVFDRMKAIFKSMKYSEAREAGWGDVEHEFLKLWVDENIPLEYEARAEVASAYSWLSRSDIFDGRIMNRQYWGFLRYSGDLLTAGIALSKKEKYSKFVKYQFPNYLRQASALSARRAMLKEIGHKIGARTHSGWKDSLDYMHILKHILDSKPEAMPFYLFDEDEAAFILELPVSEIKEKFSAKKEKEKKKETKRGEKKKETQNPKPEAKNDPPNERKNGTLSDFL